jgi:F-type H+-transporting ATPase subunit epsilon
MAGGLPTILAVNLVTPRGVVAHTDADSVQAPGELGEFELLPGHVPMLTALRPGVLTIGTKARQRYAVSSGYLRVDPSGAVEILVEQALDGDYVNTQQRAGWARARLDAVAQ